MELIRDGGGIQKGMFEGKSESEDIESNLMEEFIVGKTQTCCINFLCCCSQFLDLSDINSTHVQSYSSGGQKSKMNLIGLGGAGLHSLEALVETGFLTSLGAACLPWLWPFLHLQSSQRQIKSSHFTSLICSALPPALKDSCDHTEPTCPEQSLFFKVS